MRQMFKSTPDFKAIEPVIIHYNVGCLLDIPTGNYVKGSKGENILNGGLGLLTGIAGRGNCFKSTLSRYMTLAAASRVMESGNSTYINTYDTEMNIRPERLHTFTQRFDVFKGQDIMHQGIWNVTSKIQHSGNEWYKMLKEFLRNEKLKNRKEYMIATPMVDKDYKIIQTMFPTFGELDSISEFETSFSDEAQNKNELGDSGGNTIHMQLGLAKTRLLMELPTVCNASSHYMTMVAHIGDSSPMQQGPYTVPVKKMPTMRAGEKAKGTPDKFLFLTNSFWQITGSSRFNNQSTKSPEYPKTRDTEDVGSTDLNIITLMQLRNKSGPSGIMLDVIVSQTEGVLDTLTEFHYIKENGRYGLEGSNILYNLIFYPDVKFGRTTVRQLIDSDPKFRKAIKFTADLLQMQHVYKTSSIKIPDLKELYVKLDAQYGFDKLLETRDYWTFNQYTHPVPFLSALDLVEMFYERYVPFWFKQGENNG